MNDAFIKTDLGICPSNPITVGMGKPEFVEFVKTLNIGFYRHGVTTLGVWYRMMTIYASSDDGTGQGVGDTDFRYTITEDSKYGLCVYEQRCGRTRGCFWSDPEEARFSTDKGFFNAVQEIINAFSYDRIWHSRIGKLERW